MKRVIERKAVRKLTQEEHDQIVSDARAGIPIEHFNVRLYQNGNSRITLRKQSKAEELISESKDEAPPNTSSRRYLTNDQLMMEHIIDLESKFTKMALKHKKLKKRYNDLECSIYTPESIDDDCDEIETRVETHTEPTPVSAPSTTGGLGPSSAGAIAAPVSQSEMTSRRGGRGWRARLA